MAERLSGEQRDRIIDFLSDRMYRVKRWSLEDLVGKKVPLADWLNEGDLLYLEGWKDGLLFSGDQADAVQVPSGAIIDLKAVIEGEETI